MANKLRTQKLVLLQHNTTAFISANTQSVSIQGAEDSTPTLSSKFGRRWNLLNLIYISLAVVTIFLSRSAYAEGCTPLFILRENNGTDAALPVINNYGEDMKNEVIVREGASFIMSCELTRFHIIKWTMNNREITPQMQEEWNMRIFTSNESMGYVYSELQVFNASTKYHPGEYKCTSVCLSKDPGANLGVKVTVSIGLNVTLSNAKCTAGINGKIICKKFAQREKRVELICTAHVPDAVLRWTRKLSNGEIQDMTTICGVPDVEISDRKKPPDHCKVHRDGDATSSSIRLEIKRVRKEDNEALNTKKDFRKYTCEATRGNNQATSVEVELQERVSVSRTFDHRGVQSLTVIEGDKLEIFCDIYGISHLTLNSNAKDGFEVRWYKDNDEFNPLPSPSVKPINQVAEQEKGKPFRTGFTFDMAEREHRGEYTCEVIRHASFTVEDEGEAELKLSYYVRVKDKLGALWPFLGICGEVVVLCTIILIYEKRKSKAELEESDTDGSPDQNNSNSNSND